MHIKPLNTRFNALKLGVLMFAATTLCNENYKFLYLAITIMITMSLAMQLMVNTRPLIKLINSKLFLWSTGFIGFIMIDAYFRTQYGQMNFDYIIFLWGTIGIFSLLLGGFNDPTELLLAFGKACTIASIGVVVFIIIMEKDLILSGSVRIGSRLSGNNANVTGVYLGIYSLGILFTYIKTHKKLLLALYLIVVIFMLLTGSKKVFIPIMLGIAMYESYGGIKFRKITVLFLSLIALCVAVLTNSHLYNVIGIRVVAFLGNIGMLKETVMIPDVSTMTRVQLLTTAWHLFMEKPVLGWGYLATARFSDVHFYSHNNYLEILANYGIIGFSLYYGMVSVSLCRILKLPKLNYNRHFILALLINSLLYDVAAVNYTGLDAYIPLMIASIYLQKEIYRSERLARVLTLRNI